MKKIMVFAATSALMFAACQQNNCTVSGSIAAMEEGDTVYIQKLVDREWIPTDTAVIKNGKFEIKKNVEDTTEVRYLTFNANGRTGAVTFFLEKGNISINISEEGKREIKGTSNNDIFNVYSNASDSLMTAMYSFYEAYQADTTLTAEERNAKDEQVNKMQEEVMVTLPLNTIKENINNPVGIFLLSSRYGGFDAETLNELLAEVPANYANAPEIQTVSKFAEALKRASVGQHYTDFELKTPEGEPVKLSELIGQNKVTLLDFWASWCGPCRREMPNVVKAYEQFNKKGFGVVGVSLDSNVEAWKGAIEALGITWSQMSDLQGWQNEAAQLYAVRSIPATFLIDENGIIIAKDVRGEQIVEKLQEILK